MRCNINMINLITQKKNIPRLNISSYPSQLIANLLCNYYKIYEKENINIEFLESNIE